MTKQTKLREILFKHLVEPTLNAQTIRSQVELLPLLLVEIEPSGVRSGDTVIRLCQTE